MGSLSLLQGIFPTQVLNPGLLHGRQILYQLSPKGSPRILEWVAYAFSRDLPHPGIEPGSPTLQANSLPAKLQEKPKNTGVGSLSLLQQIFPTQELNWGVLHCRWILYQLSYVLTVWITTNWKILQEMGIPDHLTYLLRNLYAGQEATVRTLNGTASQWEKEYDKAV